MVDGACLQDQSREREAPPQVLARGPHRARTARARGSATARASEEADGRGSAVSAAGGRTTAGAYTTHVCVSAGARVRHHPQEGGPCQPSCSPALLPRRHRLPTPQDESLPPGPGPSRGVSDLCSVLTSSLRLRLLPLPPRGPGMASAHPPGHSGSEPSTRPRLQSPLGRVRPRGPGSGEPDVVFGGCCSLHHAGEGRAPFRGCRLACFIHTEPRDTWALRVAPSAERNVCGSSTNLAGTSLLFTAESYSTCGLGLVGAPPSLLLGDPGRGGDTLPTGGLPSPAPPPTPLHPPNKLPL